MVFRPKFATGAAVLACASLLLPASAAMAASGPATRLVPCGTESCLQVSGRRSDASSQVLVNGHPVAVEGVRSWKTTLPLTTVRAWSVPMARAIDVTVADRTEKNDTTESADLPIGLFGGNTDLAVLVIPGY